jgi:hypothetical protein
VVFRREGEAWGECNGVAAPVRPPRRGSGEAERVRWLGRGRVRGRLVKTKASKLDCISDGPAGRGSAGCQAGEGSREGGERDPGDRERSDALEWGGVVTWSKASSSRSPSSARGEGIEGEGVGEGEEDSLS